jgi:signal transduction histidine kinase
MSANAKPNQLIKRASQWRWAIPAAVVALAALPQLLATLVQPWIPPGYGLWITAALYGLIGLAAVWFGLPWLTRQNQIQADLQTAHQNLAKTHRQLLAAHDIGREIASAADTQKVLELAARAPTHLAGATASTVITVDADRKRLKLDMAWGLSDEYLAVLRRRMEAGIPATRCLSCKKLTARVDSGCILFGGLDDLARRQGIQSLICLPLTRDQVCEGFINAYFPSPDGPPQEQVQLLNILATEIAAALDAVRLRANQKATLYVIEGLTQAKPNLDNLLGQVLDIALAGWGVNQGAILLYNQADAVWRHYTQRGLGPEPTQPHADLALKLAQEAHRRGQPILIPDLTLSPFPGNGLRSAAAAPLLAGQDLLGVLIMVTPQPDFFQPRQAPFFAAIAHQATLAISNAKLHTQMQQMAVLEERYRLSREIHDGLAQTLSFLGWHLDHLQTLLEKKELDQLNQQLTHGRQLVSEAYMDVREAIDGLRVQGSQNGDLVTALQEYATDFQERTGLTVTLETGDFSDTLPPETGLQLLRIVQEALTNVRKHANATQVWLQLAHQLQTNRLVLTIADNGAGFDPAQPGQRGHVGMSTMRERAQSLNAELSLITGPNQGTRITVSVPTP